MRSKPGLRTQNAAGRFAELQKSLTAVHSGKNLPGDMSPVGTMFGPNSQGSNTIYDPMQSSARFSIRKPQPASQKNLMLLQKQTD